jgi:hypothetical protein
VTTPTTADPASDPMPVFIIKAKDALAAEAVAYYQQLCREHGLRSQAAEVEKAIVEMAEWRIRNRHLVRMPDHPHIPVTPARHERKGADPAADSA